MAGFRAGNPEGVQARSRRREPPEGGRAQTFSPDGAKEAYLLNEDTPARHCLLQRALHAHADLRIVAEPRAGGVQLARAGVHRQGRADEAIVNLPRRAHPI